MLIFCDKKFKEINLITNPNSVLFNIIGFKKNLGKISCENSKFIYWLFLSILICYTNFKKFRQIDKFQFGNIKTINYDMTFAD